MLFLSSLWMHFLLWVCMCELKPTSSQTGQQVEVLMHLGANNWETPMGQDFSNYTDHLKQATRGTRIACVWVSMKIPLVGFHSEDLERRNRTGLSVLFLLECSVYVYMGANKSTGLSICWSVWPAAYTFSVCECVCMHTHLLGISTQSHYWLALGTQKCSSLALTYLAGIGGMPLGPKALHIWLPLTIGMAKKDTHL